MDADKFRQAIAERKERVNARDIEDWKWLLKSPPGRRQFWDLMKFAGTFASSFSADNAHVTSHNEGMRLVGNRILERIHQASPEAYSQMRREAVSLEAEEEKWLAQKRKELED